MKNKGVFFVSIRDSKYVIVYVEKGEEINLYEKINSKYGFNSHILAQEYVKLNKSELDDCITNYKEEIRREVERKLEEERRKAKEKEDAEKAKQEAKQKKKEEKQKKRKERKEKVKTFWSNLWVRFVAGFLAAVLVLTGGHFIGKGISKALKNRDSKKPSSSQTDFTEPTVSTEITIAPEVTININEDRENIIGYDEMYDTENFELMVAEFAKSYINNGVSLTSEDLLKFATIVNIDRLVEENPDFAKELFGSQTAEEYLNDAAKTIGMTYMYNHNMWEKDKNTDNFIWISSSIPEGDPQKEKMEELEGYVTKIAKAAAKEDSQGVNKLTYQLIESLTLPDGSLNALDDGVEFGAQVYFALINNSIARNYLSQESRDYFNTRSSSEQNVSNIFTVYNRCVTNSKTRTKAN